MEDVVSSAAFHAEVRRWAAEVCPRSSPGALLWGSHVTDVAAPVLGTHLTEHGHFIRPFCSLGVGSI